MRPPEVPPGFPLLLPANDRKSGGLLAFWLENLRLRISEWIFRDFGVAETGRFLGRNLRTGLQNLGEIGIGRGRFEGLEF